MDRVAIMKKSGGSFVVAPSSPALSLPEIICGSGCF